MGHAYNLPYMSGPICWFFSANFVGHLCLSSIIILCSQHRLVLLFCTLHHGPTLPSSFIALSLVCSLHWVCICRVCSTSWRLQNPRIPHHRLFKPLFSSIIILISHPISSYLISSSFRPLRFILHLIFNTPLNTLSLSLSLSLPLSTHPLSSSPYSLLSPPHSWQVPCRVKFHG